MLLNSAQRCFLHTCMQQIHAACSAIVHKSRVLSHEYRLTTKHSLSVQSMHISASTKAYQQLWNTQNIPSEQIGCTEMFQNGRVFDDQCWATLAKRHASVTCQNQANTSRFTTLLLDKLSTTHIVPVISSKYGEPTPWSTMSFWCQGYNRKQLRYEPDSNIAPSSIADVTLCTGLRKEQPGLICK